MAFRLPTERIGRKTILLSGSDHDPNGPVIEFVTKPPASQALSPSNPLCRIGGRLTDLSLLASKYDLNVASDGRLVCPECGETTLFVRFHGDLARQLDVHPAIKAALRDASRSSLAHHRRDSGFKLKKTGDRALLVCLRRHDGSCSFNGLVVSRDEVRRLFDGCSLDPAVVARLRYESK
jgi:hypothetical protein